MDWTVYDSFTNSQRCCWNTACYATAVVSNTKFLLLVFSYNNINTVYSGTSSLE